MTRLEELCLDMFTKSQEGIPTEVRDLLENALALAGAYKTQVADLLAARRDLIETYEDKIDYLKNREQYLVEELQHARNEVQKWRTKENKPTTFNPAVSDEELDLALKNRMVTAIKAYRDRTGLDLKTSREMVQAARERDWKLKNKAVAWERNRKDND